MLIELSSFLVSKLSELEAFRQHWIKESTQSPEFFPLSMEPGEWEEQFLAFIATQENKETKNQKEER